MSQDKFYSDTVSDKLSGDDDQVFAGVDVKERAPYTPKKYYCTNCRRSIHNTPSNDQICKRNGCECKCQTHYIGRDGRPRPYGTKDDSKEDEAKPDPSYDAFVDKLNEEWQKLNPKTPVKMGDFYS